MVSTTVDLAQKRMGQKTVHISAEQEKVWSLLKKLGGPVVQQLSGENNS